MILVNVLTTIWKREVDSLRRQVCASTSALPPVLDEDAADDLEPAAPLPLKDAGPGYAALGSSGYADDTQAVAMGAASLQETFPATEEWLQVTGQDVRADKSCSWVRGEQGAPAALLRGVPIALAATFRQLGVDIAIGGSKTTGPHLSRRLEARRSAVCPLTHLSTYDRRERAISTLVTPLALHGMAVAPVAEPDMRGFGDRGGAGPLGRSALVSGQGGHLHCPFQGALRVPDHAHAPPLTSPLGRAAGGHPGLRPSYLGVRGPPSRDGPGGASAPQGGLPWLDPAARLVVLGRPTARTSPHGAGTNNIEG